MLKPRHGKKKSFSEQSRYVEILKSDGTCLEFFLSGRLPGLNEMIASAKKGRGRFNAYTREKKAITGAISEALLQYAPLPKFKNCRVGFTWYEPNKRRDKDNISAGKKYVLDALVWCGILKNDGWGDIHHFMTEYFIVAHQAGVMVLLDTGEYFDLV